MRDPETRAENGAAAARLGLARASREVLDVNNEARLGSRRREEAHFNPGSE